MIVKYLIKKSVPISLTKYEDEKKKTLTLQLEVII